MSNHIIEADVIEVTDEEEIVEEAASELPSDPSPEDPIQINPVGLLNTITAPIEVAIWKHAGQGEDPSWMAGGFVTPAPDGDSLQLNQYISISIVSPLLGQPAPTATAVLDLRQLRDADQAERVVQQLLVQARELRSQLLEQSTPKDMQPDFSDLVEQAPEG